MRWLRSAALAAAALTAVALGAVAPPAGASAPPTPQSNPAQSPSRLSAAQLAARAVTAADAATGRWAALQDEHGRFPDPVAGYGSDYGTPMLGLAMVRRGVAAGDLAGAEAGFKAIMRPVATPTDGSFELLALARAYNYGVRELAPRAQFAALWTEHEPALRRHLATRSLIVGTPNAQGCITDSRCYNNIKLVTALARVEFAATGIEPAGSGALSTSPSTSAELRRLLTVVVPKVTGDSIKRTGRAPISNAGLLSDPASNPLAYHSLSIVVLGDLLDARPAPASASTTRAFDRATRGLLAMASPSGDLAYYGRGQGQVWVPAVTAQAASAAALRAKSSTTRRRLLAIADLALARLASDYPIGPPEAALPLVPGAWSAAEISARGIDSYASARTYNGLGVDALDRAASNLTKLAARAPGERSSSVPSSLDGVVISPRQGGLITLTRGRIWAAIATRTGVRGDARYGSGLLSIERRAVSPDGTWRQAIPQPPRSAAPLPTLAVRDGDGLRVPHATSLHAGTGSALAIGSWQRDGKPGWDKGTAWVWRINGTDTVEVAFTAARPLRVVAGGLARASDRVTSERASITVTAADTNAGSGATSTPSTRYRLTVDGRVPPQVRRTSVPAGASAYDAGLRHFRVETAVRRGQRVSLQIRVRR